MQSIFSPFQWTMNIKPAQFCFYLIFMWFFLVSECCRTFMTKFSTTKQMNNPKSVYEQLKIWRKYMQTSPNMGKFQWNSFNCFDWIFLIVFFLFFLSNWRSNENITVSQHTKVTLSTDVCRFKMAKWILSMWPTMDSK